MIEYPQILKIPDEYLRAKIIEFLAEDAPDGDLTTLGTYNEGIKVKAFLQAEENLVFAGSQVIAEIFGELCSLSFIAGEGSIVGKSGIIAEIYGNAAVILTRERVLLNLLQRICGIATLTRKFAEIANPYGVRILDTRKTTPGLRYFEKYAVAAGGGWNHRLDLSSGILIKDNHIKAAGGLRNAVESIRKMKYSLPVEVETENEQQILEAINSGVDGILLDNMKPSDILKYMEIIRNSTIGKDVFVEASGGINLKNLEEYSKTGVDAISSGALTHSVKSADIHLELE